MLRVTNNTMVNDLKRTMNANMLSMADLQLQLSSGKKINKPSDDPAGIVKSLRIRSNLVESEQYRININEANSFMQAEDDALSSITDIVQKIKELTVQAATGTNSAASEDAIAQEITELNEQLKVVANTKYGDKYIFAGTNTTQAPSQGNAWKGNEELMQLEIGAGVKIPINLQMKDYFAGSLENTNLESSSGIQNLTAQHLQEGEYTIKTQLGSSTSSTATAAQSYLGTVANNGMFFYSDASTAATLSSGKTTGASDSDYNSSLVIEVTAVKTSVPTDEPAASLDVTSTTTVPVLKFDRTLYTKNIDNSVTALPSSDLLTDFTYTPASGTATLTAANYDSATGKVTFAVSAAPAEGDTIVWNNNQTVLSTDGKEYEPVTAVFDGTNWVYDDAAKVVANIKGHVYNAQGEYKYIELDNVELNMEAASGQAIFTVPSSAFNLSDGSADPDFPDALVIRNTGAALGGIDATTPQIAVGDKTIINTVAQGDGTSSEQVDIGCNYVDSYDKALGEKTQSFAFGADYFDYQSQELKFFTLDESTGLSYDGSIEITSHDFTTSDSFNNSDKTSSTFEYKAGLFDFVSTLADKVRIGKLPEVGNELEGQDVRLQKLLMYNSTVGARINRLELQTNRLTKTEETLTSLLSTTEDANEADVIMNLQLQQNVYEASLAAGARIIQPTLMDFLS